MAKKGKGGKFLSDSAYIQTGREDSPEQMDPYHSYETIISQHLSDEGADMTSSVNSESGDIMGHGAPGDPHAENSIYNPPYGGRKGGK